MAIGRKLCVVHGAKTKPRICRSVDPKVRHNDPKFECKLCGECCHTSVPVNPDSLQGKAMIQRIRERADALRSVGVDPERVIRHIVEERRVPLRRYIDAGDLQGDTFMYDSECALMVPEDILRKTKKMGKS